MDKFNNNFLLNNRFVFMGGLTPNPGEEAAKEAAQKATTEQAETQEAQEAQAATQEGAVDANRKATTETEKVGAGTVKTHQESIGAIADAVYSKDSSAATKAIKEHKAVWTKEGSPDNPIQLAQVNIEGKPAELNARQQKVLDKIMKKLALLDGKPEQQAKKLASYKKSVFKNVRVAAKAYEAGQSEKPVAPVSKVEDVQMAAAETLGEHKGLVQKTMSVLDKYAAKIDNAAGKGTTAKMVSHLEGTVKDMVARGVSEKGITAFTDKAMAMIKDIGSLDIRQVAEMQQAAQKLNREITAARYEKKYDRA